MTVNLAITTAQNTIGAGIDTLVNIENLTGSNLNDTLTGNTLANILTGGAGNDALAGGAGNDSLIGAAGNDTLNGGAGNDSMDGGAAGTDTASYQTGATAGVTVNLATAGAQNTIGAGVDTLVNFENLTGTAFADTLTGNAGANVISGLDGNDTLNGSAGNDTLTGAVGNDTLNGGAGNDSMDGGAAGSDTASYADAAAAVTVNLALGGAQNTGGSGSDTLLNFENLAGSNFNDKLTGNAGANTLSGLGGNDTLNGVAGIDTLSGGAGNDRLIGGAGDDSLDGGAGTDSFVFDKGFGKDTITGFVASGAAHDTIDFSTAVFASFAAVHSHMTQSGANVIITLDSADTITIKNVTVASLTAADFSFHPGTAPAAPAQGAAATWASHGAEANSHFHLG